MSWAILAPVLGVVEGALCGVPVAWRRARVELIQIGEGTNEIQRLVIARHLASELVLG